MKGTNMMNEKDTFIGPVEKFTLTLRHDYITADGSHYELDKPIVSAYVINHMPEVPHGVIIEKCLKILILKDLEEFLLDEYERRVGEE
jgi:hypothetical protein